MTTNLDRFRDDLKKLVKLGEAMQLDLTLRAMEEEGKLDKRHKEIKDKISGSFEKKYQRWYTESCSIINQLIKTRLEDFEGLYKGEARRKEINATTYNIQDWLN